MFSPKLTKHLIYGCAAAFAALAAPSAANAQDDETLVKANLEQKVSYVSYADLNLASAQHVDELNDRVRRAAKRVCVDERSRELMIIMHGAECRRVAIERAEPQIAAAIANAGREQMASNARIEVRVN
jgi:UrcA family protein